MHFRRWGRFILPFLFLGLWRFASAGGGNDGGGGGPIQLSNPLGKDNLKEVLTGIAPKLIELAAPIVTLMVLYGAFLMMFSGGDEEKISKGRKTIMWAAIGFLAVLLSSSVVFIIEDVFK